MKQNIGFSQFCDSFSDTYKNNFTYEGKRALFDYLEQLEEDTGEEIELDTVSLCCDYSEYESALDCIKDCGYNFTPDKEDTKADQEDAALEYLNDNTQVIVFDTGIIILAF